METISSRKRYVLLLALEVTNFLVTVNSNPQVTGSRFSVSHSSVDAYQKVFTAVRTQM